MNRLAWWGCCWAGCVLPVSLAVAPVLAASPASLSPPGQVRVELRCDAVYLPARSSWVRRVGVDFDDRRVRSVHIDGQAVHSFNVQGTVILTALDNERIRIDTAALTWSSDFRGQSTSQGRCER